MINGNGEAIRRSTVAILENEQGVRGSTTAIGRNQEVLTTVNALMEPLAPSPTGSRAGLIVAAALALLFLAGFVAIVLSMLSMRKSLRAIEARTPGATNA